jgi:hypothetical protein
MITILAISLSVEDAQAISGIMVLTGKLTGPVDDRPFGGQEVGTYKMKIRNDYTIPILKIQMDSPPKEGHEYFTGFKPDIGNATSKTEIIILRNILLSYDSHGKLLFVNDRPAGTIESGQRIGSVELPSMQYLALELPRIWEGMVILDVGDPLEDGETLPVSVTEKITPHESLSAIIWWEVGHDWIRSSIGGYERFPTITDENRNSIMVSDIFLPDLAIIQEVRCPSEKELIRAEFGSPLIIRIKEASSSFFIKYSEPGIKPQDDIYHLKLSSFYEAQINLPTNYRIISEETKVCSNSTIAFPKVIIHDVTFRLD